jgi:hypothetical protein
MFVDHRQSRVMGQYSTVRHSGSRINVGSISTGELVSYGMLRHSACVMTGSSYVIVIYVRGTHYSVVNYVTAIRLINRATQRVKNLNFHF